MKKMSDLAKVALAGYKGTPAGNYSVEDTQETIRQALVEANGGSTIMDYRAIRDGKCPGLFSLVEEMITVTVLDSIPEDSPLFDYIDWRNVKNGDSMVFEITGDGAFVVADIAKGTQGLRRQRLYSGDTITVKPVLKGVKVYEELAKILAGDVDFNVLIEKVSFAFKKQMAEDAAEALVAGFAGLAAPYSNGAAGSFDEGVLTGIIDHVEAKTGKKAVVIGAKQAVRKITGVRGADAASAKEELFAAGYYGHFYTTPIIVLQNAHKGNTNNFVLGNDLYIVAGDEKFIKGVTQGETLIIPTEPTANADLTQEYLMAQATSFKAVLAEQAGIYKLS